MWRAIARWLIILPAVVAHLLLPASLLSRLWQASYEDLPAWLAALFLGACYVAFIFVAGAWSWFGSLCRYALPVLLILVALLSFPGGRALGGRTLGGRAPADAAPPSAIEMTMQITLGAGFAAMTVFARRGRSPRTPALDLMFPLRGGTFIVGQGGASRVVNYHFAHPSQRYALDILGLNRLGVRARGLYPRQTNRYAIRGADIVSPCDGVVAAAVDGFPDQEPPDRDPVNRAGNHVAIECAGATVYLAHLMCDSMKVSTGDRVRAGQLLGRVGNSGNTTEPHLHIHAEHGAYPGRFSGRPGIPIRFGGRFLVRNDRVRNDRMRGNADDDKT